MDYYGGKKIKWREPEVESGFELEGLHYSGEL
jgi:hypothetical protein